MKIITVCDNQASDRIRCKNVKKEGRRYCDDCIRCYDGYTGELNFCRNIASKKEPCRRRRTGGNHGFCDVCNPSVPICKNQYASKIKCRNAKNLDPHSTYCDDCEKIYKAAKVQRPCRNLAASTIRCPKSIQLEGFCVDCFPIENCSAEMSA